MGKIKKYTFITIILFLAIAGAGFPAGLPEAGTDSEKEIFDRARLELFDRQWDRALTELNRLMELFPDTSYTPRVLFYKGKCYEEKKEEQGMAAKALDNYTAYLEISRNETLKEEATRGIIDLNYFLYGKKKDKRYLAKIAGFLGSRNQFMRYYAAFKLSYAADKSFAGKAVPVLKKIIAEEEDRELVERAKLALMRVAPDLLEKVARPKSLENRILKIQVYDRKNKRTTFSFNFPFMFAQLALDSLPDKEKEMLRKKGHNLDKILEYLVKSGEILRIQDKDTVFKIWIE